MITEADVVVNKIFQGRDKNLRQILWVGQSRMPPYEMSAQYDSNTLRAGRHYPKTTMAAFLKWARRDVTGLVDEYWNLAEDKHGET